MDGKTFVAVPGNRGCRIVREDDGDNAVKCLAVVAHEKTYIVVRGRNVAHALTKTNMTGSWLDQCKRSANLQKMLLQHRSRGVTKEFKVLDEWRLSSVPPHLVFR
jgi:hypothetical protein